MASPETPPQADDDGAAAAAPPLVQRRQQLEHFIRDCPADTDVYLELAAIYRQQDRPVEAMRVLKKGLEVQPDEPRLLWECEEASLARSLRQLREVAELDRRLATPEVQRELERSQTDWACRRIEVCRARLTRHPDQPQLRVVLAEALRDIGQFEEAIREAEAAAQHEPVAPQALLIQGQCLQAIGRLLPALAAYRAAALRRSVPAPQRVRRIAMRSAMDVAERLGLNLSAARYRRAWESAAEHQEAKTS